MSYSVQASNAVFNYITDKIRSGEWKSGDKIETEEQLCTQLGVSRMAVRQGIEKLSALSVVKKVQGSGTYVQNLEDTSIMGLLYFPQSLNTMLTVLEFRRMFDSYNTELFVEHAKDVEVNELKRNYNQMCAARNNPDEFQRLESEFHHLIAVGTHNVIIRQISDMLTEMLIWHQKLQYDNIGPDNSVIWHGKVLEAIEDKNGELASLCSRIHIDNSIDYIKKENADSTQTSTDSEGK